MLGNPCFQIHSSFEHQMEFNNQNHVDEMNTKLLLMLPMIPKHLIERIRLNHLKLYQDPGSVKESGSV